MAAILLASGTDCCDYVRNFMVETKVLPTTNATVPAYAYQVFNV